MPSAEHEALLRSSRRSSDAPPGFRSRRGSAAAAAAAPRPVARWPLRRSAERHGSVAAVGASARSVRPGRVAGRGHWPSVVVPIPSGARPARAGPWRRARSCDMPAARLRRGGGAVFGSVARRWDAARAFDVGDLAPGVVRRPASMAVLERSRFYRHGTGGAGTGATLVRGVVRRPAAWLFSSGRGSADDRTRWAGTGVAGRSAGIPPLPRSRFYRRRQRGGRDGCHPGGRLRGWRGPSPFGPRPADDGTGAGSGRAPSWCDWAFRCGGFCIEGRGPQVV